MVVLYVAGVKVSEAVFESLTDIANRLHHLLADHCDLSGRNILLAQFVQYIFQHPQVALDKASTEAGHETSEATQSNKTKGLSNSNPGLLLVVCGYCLLFSFISLLTLFVCCLIFISVAIVVVCYTLHLTS